LPCSPFRTEMQPVPSSFPPGGIMLYAGNIADQAGAPVPGPRASSLEARRHRAHRNDRRLSDYSETHRLAACVCARIGTDGFGADRTHPAEEVAGAPRAFPNGSMYIISVRIARSLARGGGFCARIGHVWKETAFLFRKRSWF